MTRQGTSLTPVTHDRASLSSQSGDRFAFTGATPAARTTVASRRITRLAAWSRSWITPHPPQTQVPIPGLSRGPTQSQSGHTPVLRWKRPMTRHSRHAHSAFSEAPAGARPDWRRRGEPRATTGVSFDPPHREESGPANRDATSRLNPPGNTQVLDPVTANSRRSTCRSSSRPSIRAGRADNLMQGWLRSFEGSAKQFCAAIVKLLPTGIWPDCDAVARLHRPA